MITLHELVGVIRSCLAGLALAGTAADRKHSETLLPARVLGGMEMCVMETEHQPETSQKRPI